MPVQVVVSEVEPARTFALRQRVLRPHQSLEQMALFDDGSPDSASFAATESPAGEVVGTANVRRAALPPGVAGALPAGASDLPPWRLRGMATREDLRSQGIGASVLTACVDHIARNGGGILWCNARTGAAGFYRRAGFSKYGDQFEEVGVGPHIVMWRLVDPAGARDGATSAPSVTAASITTGGAGPPGSLES